MTKYVKKRNWCFIVYLDSAPENWRDILQETGCMFAISPYHDRDVNPDGSVKKPHYHVIICYDGPTTYNVVKKVTDSVNGTIPQPLEQIRGYYRYFTHIDNPDKFQYDEKDITTINGFDINNYVEMTYTEVSRYLLQLQSIIRTKHIVEYSDLLDLLMDSDCRELWDVAKNHTILLDRYISSRRYKTKKEKAKEEFDDVVSDIL